MDEDKSVNQESFEKQKLEQLENELEGIDKRVTQEVPLKSGQPIQQPNTPQPDSHILSEEPNPQGLGKSKGILWIGTTLLVLALVGVGAYYVGSNRTVPSPTPPPPSTPEPTPSIRVIVPAEIPGWETYTDASAMVSFQYSPSITLTKPIENNGEVLYLKILIEKIEEIEARTINYDRETALEDKELLIQGKYGNNVDFALKQSEEIINLAGINAKSFIVLGRFDTYDVTFERILILFTKDYRLIITLYGSKSDIVQESVEYFTTYANYGYEPFPIWDLDNNAEEKFYNALAKGEGSPSAQGWYDTFDQILSTFKFIEASPEASPTSTP